jgi:diketogulonate reductase-like aldo/keto reductase
MTLADHRPLTTAQLWAASVDKFRYYIHNPFVFNEAPAIPLQEAWAAMESVQALGLTRSIGVSNFTPLHLKTILSTAKVVPAVNQIEFQPYSGPIAPSTLKFCAEKGIKVAGYSALASLGTAKGGPVDELVEKLSVKYGKSTGGILLRWANLQGVTLITTSAKESRLKQYLDDVSGWDLESADVDAIWKKGAEGKTFRGYFKEDRKAAEELSLKSD